MCMYHMCLATQRPSECCGIFLHDITNIRRSVEVVETEQLFRHRVDPLTEAPWPEDYLLIYESKQASCSGRDPSRFLSGSTSTDTKEKCSKKTRII